MKLLLKTNDPVVISFVEALMKESEIDYLVLDQHMSIVEGSLGVIPRRILVKDEFHLSAQQILRDADLGHQLATEAG